jgi:hypothetical protein
MFNAKSKSELLGETPTSTSTSLIGPNLFEGDITSNGTLESGTLVEISTVRLSRHWSQWCC